MLRAGHVRWPRGGEDMEWIVRTPHGRTLAVEDAGDRTGRPVLVYEGTPRSRHLYGPWVAHVPGGTLRLPGHHAKLGLSKNGDADHLGEH